MGIISKFKEHLGDAKIDIIKKIKTEITELEKRMDEKKSGKKDSVDKDAQDEEGGGDMKS